METFLLETAKQLGNMIGIGAGGTIVVLLGVWFFRTAFIAVIKRQTAEYLQQHKADLDEDAAERRREFENALDERGGRLSDRLIADGIAYMRYRRR